MSALFNLQFRRCLLTNFKVTNFKMATLTAKILAAILDIKTDNFSSSESQGLRSASHQVLAKSDLPFGSWRHLKIFKMATGHLGYWNGMILAVLTPFCWYFSYFCIKHMLWVLIKVPRWGTSGDSPQHTVLCRNKKNIYLIPPLSGVCSHGLKQGNIILTLTCSSGSYNFAIFLC